MAYSKHTPKSRKYRKSKSHAKEHNSHSQELSHIEEQVIPPVESANSNNQKKNPSSFGFLSSIFRSSEKTERSGTPIFNILDHDIYFDDILLAGLILLLLTDKVEDEILLIILAYLLLDIF